MNKKAVHQRLSAIQLILKRYGYGGNQNELYYMPVKKLDEIITYLEDTPRFSSVGRRITQEWAAKVIGATLYSNGDLRLAMRYDVNDNQFNKIKSTLVKRGFDSEETDFSEAEMEIRKAILYADDVVFMNFHFKRYEQYLPALFDYVAKNPSLAYRIMEIAKTRNSIDVEGIDQTLQLGNTTLESGVL